MFSTRILSVLFGVAIAACCQSMPALETEAATEDNALDALLLDDIDGDLLDELEPLPKKSADSGREAEMRRLPKEDPPQSSADREDKDEEEATNLEQSGGEDVDIGKVPDPLTRIGLRMRTVKSLIDRRDTSTETQQLQGEILDDISALIAKLQTQQRRQESDGNPSSQDRLQSGEGGGVDPARSNPGPENSTDRVEQSDTALTALQRQQELLRRMNWGSLPERLRDQVRSSRVERFLPKYAQLIEQYYKRLADETQYQP